MGDLLDIAREALSIVRSAGAQWADVACGRARELGVEIEGSSIKSAESADSEGLSIRAFFRGGQASVTLEGLDLVAVRRAAREAAEMARVTEPDPDFVALPVPEDAERVPGLYDKRLADLSITECIRFAVANIAGAQKVHPDVLAAGGIGVRSGESAIVNTAGVELERSGTLVDGAIFSIVRQGSDVGSFQEFDRGRSLADVNLENLGEIATRGACDFLGSRKIPSGRMDLVLAPLSSYHLFSLLLLAANAESIQRRRSFFVEMLGKKVCSEVLTIVDDGLVARGIASDSHDGEGAARKAVTVIEKGVLRALLHNSYTANKARVPNTGHGGRFGGISPTNVRVTPGTSTLAEIIRGTSEGLLLKTGAFALDMTSGDISSSLDFAFKIENGEVAYPVSGTMIGGHVFDFLKQIDAVSSDYREEPGNIIPSIRIRDVQVIGGK